MAPVIKLTYFNGRGRAELSRLIMAQAGIAYQDIRVDFQDWQNIKEGTLFGSMPFLEYDGELIGQSMTIARFLARKAGLGGTNELQQAKAEMMVEFFKDFTDGYPKMMFCKDPVEKAEMAENFCGKFLPAHMKRAEGLLEKNGGKYFVGSDLTFADLAFFDNANKLLDPGFLAFTGFEDKWDRLNYLKDYPLLADLKKRVEMNAGIQDWLSRRPVGMDG